MEENSLNEENDSKFILGLGNYSKYYLYILGTIFFRSLKDCIFGFISIDPESKTGLFGFIPVLSRHYLLQDFLRYISFILGGLIFIYILKKKESKENYKPSKQSNKYLKLKNKGLIQNKKNVKFPIYTIIKVCFIFCFHSELSRIMYLFDFNGLDFWIFDIFTLFFMDTYFAINYYNIKNIQ